jgi:hypothetical protein
MQRPKAPAKTAALSLRGGAAAALVPVFSLFLLERNTETSVIHANYYLGKLSWLG